MDLGQYAQREIHLRKQEDDGELKYVVIKNDGETQLMVWLITLKNIFSKQLPNMPKEYIVRLVMNPNHHSMLCMKNGQVIGGITTGRFGGKTWARSPSAPSPPPSRSRATARA